MTVSQDGFDGSGVEKIRSCRLLCSVARPLASSVHISAQGTPALLALEGLSAGAGTKRHASLYSETDDVVIIQPTETYHGGGRYRVPSCGGLMKPRRRAAEGISI